ERLGFGDLGDVLGVAEAGRWLGLGILVGDGPGGTNQDRVFGFSLPFGAEMHTGTVSRLAGADSAPITFDNRQFRRTRGATCQTLVGPGVSVTTLGQFRTDVVHDSFNCLG